MNASDYRGDGRDARFEVVLRFVVIAVQEVIDAEIQLDGVVELLGDAGIENGESGGDDGRILAIQAIVVDCAHAERAAPAVIAGEDQTRVGDEMRSAIDVNAMIAAAKEGIGNFGETTVEREM